MNGYDDQDSPIVNLIDKLLTIVAEYLVWIGLIGIIILQIYVPIDFEEIVAFVIFWAPAGILLLGLLLIFSKNAFRFRRDRERSITQYEISVVQPDIYIIDAIIYLGTIAILAIPYFIDYLGGIDILDFVQVIIFFTLANLLKKVILKKY